MSVLVLPADLARRVQRGVKTMHRIKPARGRMRPELDASVPVQVRSHRAGICEVITVCRVQILDIGDGLLHEVSDAEWRADGHQSRGAYFAWWREIVEGVEPPASQDEPYNDIAVWVVRFQLEQRRFLASRPGLPSDKTPAEAPEARGYTSNPVSGLHGERQVVDPTGPRWNQKLELDRRIRWAQERDAIAGAIERLLADPDMRATVGSDLRVLQRRLAAIDRDLYGIAA